MAIDPSPVRLLRYMVPLVILALLWMRFNPAIRGFVADFAAPFLEGRHQVDWQLQHTSQLTRSKVDLVKEMDELRRKLENLQLSQRDLRLLEDENDQLRRQLELSERTRYRLLAASILASDTATGGRTYIVDRGQHDGIQIGQPVMRGGNLDGRVLAVSSRTATVLRLTDPNCKVSVRLRDTAATGVLVGRGENRWRAQPWCLLTYLPRDLDYREGMVVETSDLGLQVPAGIPVGVLSPIPAHDLVDTVDSLYKTATVLPYAATDSQRYSFVLVVLATISPDTRAALSAIPESAP